MSGKTRELIENVHIPKMVKVRQIFSGDHLDEAQIPSAILYQLKQPEFAGKIKPGMRIAVTAGSRGIANIALITKTIVEFVKSKEAVPFIVTAMGSHGGGAKGNS